MPSRARGRGSSCCGCGGGIIKACSAYTLPHTPITATDSNTTFTINYVSGTMWSGSYCLPSIAGTCTGFDSQTGYLLIVYTFTFQIITISGVKHCFFVLGRQWLVKDVTGIPEQYAVNVLCNSTPCGLTNSGASQSVDVTSLVSPFTYDFASMVYSPVLSADPAPGPVLLSQ